MIGSSEKGKAVGALDLLFDALLKIYRTRGLCYFDLGSSEGEDDLHLNQGLIDQKEGYGARAVVMDSYRLVL